jgi:hypothetical protein
MAAFAAAPTNSLPCVVVDGRTIADLDPEAGFAPSFASAEAQRIYREIVDQRRFEQEPSKP